MLKMGKLIYLLNLFKLKTAGILFQLCFPSFMSQPDTKG